MDGKALRFEMHDNPLVGDGPTETISRVIADLREIAAGRGNTFNQPGGIRCTLRCASRALAVAAELM